MTTEDLIARLRDTTALSDPLLTHEAADALEAHGLEVAEQHRMWDTLNVYCGQAERQRDDAIEERDQARAELAAIRATQEPEQAVYLVCTGETHNGEETYTRHDVLPPLCDTEKLYASPVAKDAGLVADGWKLTVRDLIVSHSMNASCQAGLVPRCICVKCATERAEYMLAASPKIGGV